MTQTGGMSDVEVQDNPPESRVEGRVDGELAGFAAYVDRDGARVFTHTEVAPAYGGRGVGGAIARGALDGARAAGRSVVPQCPFIKGWIPDLTSHDPYYVTPVLMTITMVLSQLLTPQTAQNQQMKFMMYGMPLMFGFFMLNLPAGRHQ